MGWGRRGEGGRGWAVAASLRTSALAKPHASKPRFAHPQSWPCVRCWCEHSHQREGCRRPSRRGTRPRQCLCGWRAGAAPRQWAARLARRDRAAPPRRISRTFTAAAHPTTDAGPSGQRVHPQRRQRPGAQRGQLAAPAVGTQRLRAVARLEDWWHARRPGRHRHDWLRGGEAHCGNRRGNVGCGPGCTTALVGLQEQARFPSSLSPIVSYGQCSQHIPAPTDQQPGRPSTIHPGRRR